MLSKSQLSKWTYLIRTYGTSGNNCRVETLSKSYLSDTRIIKSSLKLIRQSKYAYIKHECYPFQTEARNDPSFRKASLLKMIISNSMKQTCVIYLVIRDLANQGYTVSHSIMNLGTFKQRNQDSYQYVGNVWEGDF